MAHINSIHDTGANRSPCYWSTGPIAVGGGAKVESPVVFCGDSAGSVSVGVANAPAGNGLVLQSCGWQFVVWLYVSDASAGGAVTVYGSPSHDFPVAFPIITGAAAAVGQVRLDSLLGGLGRSPFPYWRVEFVNGGVAQTAFAMAIAGGTE